MNMVQVQMDVPEALTQFVMLEDEQARTVRNAMMLYPFIRKGEISRGYAAEVLGIPKWELIALYGSLDLPYFTQSEEELQDDLQTLKSLRSSAVC